MLLRQDAAVLEEDNADWVLGDTSAYPTFAVSVDVISDLEKAGVEDAAHLFEGIRVYRPEQNLLDTIVASYLKKSAVDREPSGRLQAIRRKDLLRRRTLSSDEEQLCKTYDLNALLGKLRTLTKKTDVTPEALAQEKRAALVDFLPTTMFADISRFFGCEPGTVRFLGVVLNYQGTQVVRNEAEIRIRNLLNVCGKHGYRAVVFDSSAGVQSTAHALHAASDVIVYCMRPSTQFIKGTATQLDNYRGSLLRQKSALAYQRAGGEPEPGSPEDLKKPVILLPTAVPRSSDYQALREESFGSIRLNLLAKKNQELVDDTFCTPDTALNEIELFKWREQILGVPEVRAMSEKVAALTEDFSTEAGIARHEDAAQAYRVYRRLAERLVENS